MSDVKLDTLRLFSREFINENKLANFSESRLDDLLNHVQFLMGQKKFSPPYRHGRFNTTSVLDANGNEVFNSSQRNGRNARSKSKLVLALLNTFYS